MSGMVVLEVNISKQVLELEEMEVVNEVMDGGFLYLTIPVWFLTVLLNTSVVMILWENMTPINKFMILDALISILYSSLSTFQQSPYYMGLSLDVCCIPLMIMLSTCMQANRILPSIIALYRFLSNMSLN